MRPTVGKNRGDAGRPSLRSLRAITAALAAAVIMVGGYLIMSGGSGGASPLQDLGDTDEAPNVIESSTTTSSTTTTSTTIVSTTTSNPAPAGPPLPGDRPVIASTEAEPEAKQLAADIAYALTTYEVGDDHEGRLEALAGPDGADALALASAPLTHPGYWSRGEVIYPQLGGMRNDKASVMVVTRQWIGTGTEPDHTVVRTLDIRLARGDAGWEFDYLSSAGGTFDGDEELAAAHAVAADPRIVMPDSARLDILSGIVSPALLEVMAELAEQTSYEVVVLATGHPRNVFETDSLSHHTVGQAVDINRIGDRLVVDDRSSDSVTRAIVQWLYDNPDVHQIGSPWDIDGERSRRSFTDLVHQDHIHLAVTN